MSEGGIADLTSLDIKSLSREQKLELLALAQEKEERIKYNKIDTMFPDTGPLSRDKYSKHIKFLQEGANYMERALFGGNRPLWDETEVWMADGSVKPLKEVKIGDKVLSYNLKTGVAEPSNVINVPYRGFEKSYKLTTSNGDEVIGTSDHCFPIWNKSGHTKQIVKSELSEISVDNTVSKRKGFVVPKEFKYNSKEQLEIHPYVLGCLLGDGCLGHNSVTFTNKDLAIIDKFKSLCDYNLKQIDSLTYRLQQGSVRCATTGDFLPGRLNTELNSLNLKVNGKDKHIPLKYISASEKDRLELLAGLIDTDGTNQEFTNKSEQLVKDFCRLVISLGGYARYKQCEKTCTNTGAVGTYYRSYYRLNREIPVTLEYKQQKITKRARDYSRLPIVSREYVGSKPVRCITVDHPDHTFIINNGIVTYNSGKSMCAAVEITYHLTGNYPHWWKGKRFDRAVKVWVISKDNQQSKEAAQEILLGRQGNFGTGLIPRSLLAETYTKPGVPGAIVDAMVKHTSGDISTVTFKSCQQDMDSFMGAAVDVAWFDEEPKKDIYGEVLMRLVTTNGIALATFTPLDGYTEVVKGYLSDGKFPSEEQCKKMHKYITNVEWDDAPHLSDEQKEAYARTIPAYLKEARMKGIPSVGDGRIYDIPESDFVVSPFEIPLDWPRCYAFDVGAKVNAAVWAAYDKNNDTWYITDEYYAIGPNPDVHASAIRRKCKWFMPGLLDSAARQTSQLMETSLWDIYVELGLNVEMPNKSIEAGIARTYDRLATGRLKVFRSCQNLLQEYRLYKYDSSKPGHPARHQADHALDSLRYIMMTGEEIMETPPDLDDNPFSGFVFDAYVDNRDSITGY